MQEMGKEIIEILEYQGCLKDGGWVAECQPDDDTCTKCIANCILAVMRNWAIKQRAKYDAKREKSKIDDPQNTQNLIVLGAKVKAFQQVIDKCHFVED